MTERVMVTCYNASTGRVQINTSLFLYTNNILRQGLYQAPSPPLSPHTLLLHSTFLAPWHCTFISDPHTVLILN